MKLIHPKHMTDRQESAFRLALVSSGFTPAVKEVLSVVSDQLHSVEPGVIVLGSSFPIAGAGAIGALAADKTEHLILVNVFSVFNAVALCRTFSQADWIVKNFEVLEKFYPDIVMAENPRHWIFTEDISPDVVPLLNRFPKEFETFKYHGLDMGGERWIVIEKFGAKKETARLIQVGSSAQSQKKSLSSLHFHSILSKEEVDDFFEKDSAGEDVTV